MSEGKNIHVEAFSLVEMLVGLILISILAASLSALGTQFRSLLKVTDENSQRMELEATVRKISEILEQAEAMPVEVLEGGQSLYLKGSKTDVQFVATASLGVRTTGLRTIKIERVNAGELILSRQYRRFSQTSGQRVAPAASLLNEVVSTLNFSYYGRLNETDRVPVWQNEWKIPGALPSAISVTISGEYGSGKSIVASGVAWIGRP